MIKIVHLDRDKLVRVSFSYHFGGSSWEFSFITYLDIGLAFHIFHLSSSDPPDNVK